MRFLVRTSIFLLISLAFLFSTLRLTDDWEHIAINIVYASVLVLVFVTLLFKDKTIRFNSATLIMMIVFTVFSIISALFNQDVDLIFRMIVFFLLFLSTSIFVPSYLKDETLKYIVVSLYITHLPILLIPFLTQGIDRIPYYGIFSNPNSVAGAAVTLLAVSTALFIYQLERFYSKEKSSKMSMLSHFSVMVFLLIIIAYSASRTSFLAVAIVLLAGLSSMLIALIKRKKLGVFIFRSILFMPIVLFMLFLTNKYTDILQIIDDTILNKFSRKSSDTLDGRSAVWNEVINNGGFFGRGSDMFYGDITIGAHNTYISMLGSYGWMPFLMFIFISIMTLYHSIRYTFTSESKYKYLPVLLSVLFISLSMAEDMNWKASIIAFFVISGIVLNKNKIMLSLK